MILGDSPGNWGNIGIHSDKKGKGSLTCLPLLHNIAWSVFFITGTTIAGKHMKTYSVKASDIKRDWFIVDAKDKILGRLATEVATILRGKHKPQFTPHMDMGDFIIVINAEKIRVTGKKLEQKIYYRHSGYLGGLKEENLEKVLAEKPEQAVMRAVKGMLPSNKLGRAMLKKLKVYAGGEHPHEAQAPKQLDIGA